MSENGQFFTPHFSLHKACFPLQSDGEEWLLQDRKINIRLPTKQLLASGNFSCTAFPLKYFFFFLINVINANNTFAEVYNAWSLISEIYSIVIPNQKQKIPLHTAELKTANTMYARKG